MVFLFKIWNSTRSSKYFISVKDDESQLYETLVLRASQKMKINGSKLVLESDGTCIDEDDVLKIMVSETLILLESHETWTSPSESLSNSSTLTATSDGSSDIFPDLERLDVVRFGDVSLAHDADRNLPDETINSPNRTNQGIHFLTPTTLTSWRDFVIPWNKVSSLSAKALENHTRDERAITEITHLVADEIKAKESCIPSKHLKIIAQEICKKYPDTSVDKDDDGVVIGEGYHGIFYKLQDRLKYLNRSNRKRSSSETTKIPLHKKKKMLAAKAGCSQWAPPIASETSSSVQDDQTALKFLNYEEDFTEDDVNLLKRTYPEQRKFLNRTETPTIQQIKDEWPILLSQNGIYWHFLQLMNIDIHVLCDAMLLKAFKILNFGLSKKFINTTEGTEDEKLLNILKTITSFFSENLNNMISPILDDQEDIDTFWGTSPFLAIKNEVREETTVSLYFVVMEKVKINNGTQYFRDALQQLFAIYFNFNLAYPKSVSNTLEFLQSYFLKIRPDVGTKNSKKHSQMKLLSLMNKFRD